jgi:hypothetical protein
MRTLRQLRIRFGTSKAELEVERECEHADRFE